MRALVIVYSNCSKLLIINHLPTQKCVNIFPNTSSAKIWPRPVMLARSSKTSLRSSETKSPLRPDSREDRTRERFSWALTNDWYWRAEETMMSCSESSGMWVALKIACSSLSMFVPCLAEISTVGMSFSLESDIEDVSDVDKISILFRMIINDFCIDDP